MSELPRLYLAGLRLRKRMVETMKFTHFDEAGNARMVDVGEKADTVREAKARGCIFMSRECLDMVMEGTMKKGDVLGTARIAGIMGAKRTWELIPLCHPLPLSSLAIDFSIKSLLPSASFGKVTSTCC